MKLPVNARGRVGIALLCLVFLNGVSYPADTQESVFQVIALNRLMQVASDAMLPLTFDVPVAGGGPAITAQLSDLWYCDGNQTGVATAVVVIVPAGTNLPKRMASQADCSSHTLDSLMDRLKALQPRPADWMAAAFLSASYSSGRINLAFTQSRSDVRPGATMPTEITALISRTNSTFRSLDTTNVALTVQGKTQMFTLAFLFQQSATTVFGFPQSGQVPATLSMPADVSLQNLPKATNCIFRVSHQQAKQELGGPLSDLTFPLQAGGQTFTVSNFQVNGGMNLYQTIGTISSGGSQFHPTINWGGTDLGFQNVRLAEASVNCGNFDFACKARKGAAEALQNVLTSMAPQGKPLRPVTGKDVSKFQISGKTYALRITVLRSSSTNDSLQLPSFLSVEQQ